MSKFNKVNISCDFLNKCNNYKVECHRCRMNGINNFGNYLALKSSDGRQIKYLEKNGSQIKNL